MTIQVNPRFKSLIPPLAPEELAQLESNIVTDGCRDPLVTWNNTLLDGHNRFEICTRLKLPFNTTPINLPNEDAAMDWIDTNQLGRRNLAPDQLSYIRGRLYNRKKRTKAEAGAMGGSSKLQSDTCLDTATAIADKHGVSRATVIRDGKRAEAIDKLAEIKPEEAEAVRNGLKRFNEVRREIKLAEVKGAAKLPEAKYRVIYADPPWKYGDTRNLDGWDATAAQDHYPTMSIQELCSMPIKTLCESDAVLFLWVTSPLLFECAPVIDAWGFQYKACFVWDKVRHNLGHYNSARHEFLLICTRGSCTPDSKELFDSVQTIERTGRHSEKPKEFRGMIDTLYPHGKRLELFSRKKVTGWEAWGNQV